jgi:hypothetical protein
LQKIETWIDSLSTRKRCQVPLMILPRRLRSDKGKTVRLLCLITVFATTSDLPVSAHKTVFDTDSKEIYIDNCATACITNDLTDCQTTPIPINRKIKGIAGAFNAQVYATTINWNIEDDDGVSEVHVIPNSFFVPVAPHCLLSPQHWAQTRKRFGIKARCVTYDSAIILQWDNKRKIKTMPLDIRGSNVGVIRTSPGYTSFSAFCKDTDRTSMQDDQEPITVDANLVSDDESSVDQDQEDLDDEHPEIYFPIKDQPLQTDFELNGPKQSSGVVVDEEDLNPQDKSVQLLQLHHRYGHISMERLQEMAKQGIIPNQLANCRVPLCTSCLYGKATRRPWRNKPSKQDQQHIITYPGECVSVDQLVSNTPGLIAQLRGRPTTKRYMAATVFVDHFSRLSFIHLQKTTSADETIEGKLKFEAYAASCGVKIKHYHADNGVFADNKFRKEIMDSRQTLSFCGVNAHFQNSVAERRIRQLQDLARTMLIHASRRWPTAIDSHLWPYALRYANDMFNNTPYKLNNNESPMGKFSGSKVEFNPKHAHTFGCPVYVLDNVLQQGKKIDKWTERARVGIFLGLSPQHARTVGLVLSITSGLTSPQFYMKFDEGFQTMRNSFGNTPPVSKWQEICGFRRVQKLSTHLVDAEIPKQITQLPKYKASSVTIKEPEGVPNVTGNEQNIEKEDNVRRSTRQRKYTEDYLQYMEQRNISFVAYETVTYLELDPVTETHPLQLYKAHSDPDTMYWHQAMKAPDRHKFINAAIKEVQDHTQNKLWEIIHRSQVPRGALVAPAVWSMKRKRRISTQEVYKWKARLAFDGSKQTKDINYWDTYSPVVQWPVVRFLLTHALINKWKFRQIDFVLAYTQAGPETDLYMKPPKGFEVAKENPEEYVLKIKKELLWSETSR